MAKTTELKKNKAIGAQQGFADTFNWVVRSMKNLQGGQGCAVNWVADDMPVVDVNMYECANDYSNSAPPPDTEVDIEALGDDNQKSIQTRVFNEGEEDEFKMLQLYGFNDNTATDVTKETLENYHFVMRDNTNHEITYANVSGIGDEPDGDVSSGEYAAHGAQKQYSLQTHKFTDPEDQEDKGLDVLELYGFHNFNNGIDLDKFLPSSYTLERYQFLVRDKTNKTLSYANMAGLFDIKLTGTNGYTYLKGDDFTFASASDSNVVVSPTLRNGVKTLEIGVYYI